MDTEVNKNFRIMWNYQYGFAYCPIPKTGTTMWMNILFDLVPGLDQVAVAVRSKYKEGHTSSQASHFSDIFWIKYRAISSLLSSSEL